MVDGIRSFNICLIRILETDRNSVQEKMTKENIPEIKESSDWKDPSSAEQTEEKETIPMHLVVKIVELEG